MILLTLNSILLTNNARITPYIIPGNSKNFKTWINFFLHSFSLVESKLGRISRVIITFQKIFDICVFALTLNELLKLDYLHRHLLSCLISSLNYLTSRHPLWACLVFALSYKPLVLVSHLELEKEPWFANTRSRNQHCKWMKKCHPLNSILISSRHILNIKMSHRYLEIKD